MSLFKDWIKRRLNTESEYFIFMEKTIYCKQCREEFWKTELETHIKK